MSFMTAKLQTILRYLFILLMLTTSIGKLLDNRGFAEVIKTYQLIPIPIELPLGLAFSLMELALGLCLIRSFRLKECAWALIGLHIGYTLLAVLTLTRGIEILNCGCFGIFWARPLTLVTVFEDLVLLGLSFWFYFLVRRSPRSSHV